MSTKMMVFIIIIIVSVGVFGISAILAIQHQYETMKSVLGGAGIGGVLLLFGFGFGWLITNSEF